MRTDAFDFALPEDRIALRPATPRDSAGLLVVREVSWPIVDLRVDWSDHDPLGALAAAWEIYAPQIDDYVRRALDPGAAPGFGVPGNL